MSPLGGETFVIQFDDVSAMVEPVNAHWVGGGLNRGTMDATNTSAQENALPPALAMKPNNSASHHMSLALPLPPRPPLSI